MMRIRFKKTQRGFTLIETIVSMSLVATVLLMTTNIFVKVITLSNSSDLEAKMQTQMEGNIAYIQDVIRNASCINISDTSFAAPSSLTPCSMTTICPTLTSQNTSGNNLIIYYLSGLDAPAPISPTVSAVILNTTQASVSGTTSYWTLDYSQWELSNGTFVKQNISRSLVGDTLSTPNYQFELTTSGANDKIFQLNCGNGVVRPYIITTMHGVMKSQVTSLPDIGPVDTLGEASLENFNY